MTSPRHFPPPRKIEQIPDGYRVLDAFGQALVYIYARETRQQAEHYKMLTFDEARRGGLALRLIQQNAEAGPF